MTRYFQKHVRGQTRRVLIGRYPIILADVARQTALGFASDWGRGVGKLLQIGTPTLGTATESYLARPKLRSEARRSAVRHQFELHLKDWLRLPLDEITKSMVVERHRSMAAKPSPASHTLKYFRTVWNHALRVHELPESPTMAIEWYEERPNGSIIEDLSVWRKAVDELYNPIQKAFYEFALVHRL
ncbi:hypothetical protein [uncultured Ruegeria sp.]|uniref:hypothetical protein n=1 Tax=uncultured Ruegeria sp. TaxID=259304 RepID=UPI00344FDD70